MQLIKNSFNWCYMFCYIRKWTVILIKNTVYVFAFLNCMHLFDRKCIYILCIACTRTYENGYTQQKVRINLKIKHLVILYRRQKVDGEKIKDEYERWIHIHTWFLFHFTIFIYLSGKFHLNILQLVNKKSCLFSYVFIGLEADKN